MHALSEYFMACNFVDVRPTLTNERKVIRSTPATAARIIDRVWKIEEIVAQLSE